MVEKITVKLVVLGYLRNYPDFKQIQNWDSDVFRITEIDRFEQLPNRDGNDWEYTDQMLNSLIPDNKQASITIAIIDAPLEDNYYSRRLDNNRIAVSLFEVSEILEEKNIPIINFILREIYEFVVTFKKYSKVPALPISITHDETRSCIFDMNAYKSDIIYSTEKVGLCDKCKVDLKGNKVPVNFLESVEEELKRVRKSAYYRIADFIKAHPILSLTITFLAGILINLISNYIYDLLKLRLSR